MEQNMITLATDMQLSMERLEEIFSVPKTKELFEKLIKQESNEVVLKDLSARLEGVIEGKDFIMSPVEAVKHRIKCYILADSIEKVINGKCLDQSIQEEIQKQLKEATVFGKVEVNLEELEKKVGAMRAFQNLIENLLS